MKKDKWNIQFRRRHFRNTIVPFSKQTLQDFSGKQNMFYILKNQEPLIPYEVPSMVLPTCLQDFNLPSYWNFQGDQSRRGKRQHAFSWEILHVEWNLLLPGYLNTIYEMSFHTLKSTLKTPDMTRFVFLNAPFSSCFPFWLCFPFWKIKSICSIPDEVWKQILQTSVFVTMQIPVHSKWDKITYSFLYSP